jgi:signal transduction histidine kinase/CheY-like chemotaxis protein/HPt (histidine-containing phosphotransfer) domain-containing protein
MVRMVRNLDVWERSHMRLANTITVVSMILYFVLRYIHLSLDGQTYQLPTLLLNTPIVALVMLLVLLFSRTISQLAVLMPACLALGIFLTCILQDGIPYSFIAFVGACAVCGVYFNTRAFIKFALGLNIAIFIAKVVLGLDLTGPEISQVVSYLMWGLMQLCIIVIFVAVHHAAQKYKLSKRSMRSYHAMLASTPNLVALVDKENRIYHISDKLAELASVQRLDMVLGRPILDVFDNPDMIEMIAETLDAGAPYESTATVKSNDQSDHIHYKITSTPMNITKGDLCFIDISDITPIMNARYEAESASRAKSDFLSKMSHEIRTPLNGIMGMAEVMSYENIASKTRDQLDAIKQSGNHLLSIINNLLDFSKIEHGKLEVVPKYYLFNTLIQDVISIITMQMKAANLQLTVYVSRKIPEELYGDIVRIRQILLNILSNAVKYTREGHVSLEVMGTMTGVNTIDISFKVTDTGIGLKQEDIDTLYDEFVQFDLDRHHGIEGTGLGLSITYSLVKMMKGNIEVESVYGEGSTFTVTLPQKFRRLGTAPFVTDRENKNVLLYGLPTVHAKSITRALDDLGVRHHIAENEAELFCKLSEEIWHFVFATPNLAALVEDMCERAVEHIIQPGIVVVADSRRAVKENSYATLAVPAYGLPIIDVLNYVQNTGTQSDSNVAVKNLINFTAPDARVLVVDDISTNLQVAKGLLEIYEMQIDICISGPEAIEAVKATQYDLILMDHMMPGMDGITAMGAIRSLEGRRYVNVPIVALTANAILGTMEMLLAKGFDDFLAKPIDVAKLNTALERWIPREKQLAADAKRRDRQDPAVEEELNLEIEGADLTKGMRMAGGSLQAYLEILNVFEKDGPLKIKEIKDCLAVGNLKLYTIHVHALKVALANIGADLLSRQAQALENAGNNEDMVYILNSGNEFIQNLEKLLTSVAAFLGAHGSKAAPGAPMDKEDIAQCLASLITALENFDLAEIDKASAALRSAASGDVESILKKVLVGEYDDAIENIDKILSTRQPS